MTGAPASAARGGSALSGSRWWTIVSAGFPCIGAALAYEERNRTFH